MTHRRITGRHENPTTEVRHSGKRPLPITFVLGTLTPVARDSAPRRQQEISHLFLQLDCLDEADILPFFYRFPGGRNNNNTNADDDTKVGNGIIADRRSVDARLTEEGRREGGCGVVCGCIDDGDVRPSFAFSAVFVFRGPFQGCPRGPPPPLFCTTKKRRREKATTWCQSGGSEREHE